jgi:hypothetical protein
VFIVLSHHRRHALHFNVVESPSGCWTTQQLWGAFPVCQGRWPGTRMTWWWWMASGSIRTIGSENR